MTTLPDQTIPADTWTEVTSLVNATSYVIQNKSVNVDMFVAEEASAPVGTTGRVIQGFDDYSFTKGTDSVFVYFPSADGLIAVNEGV